MKAQKCEGSTEKPAETRWEKVERWEVNRVRSVHGPRQVIKSLDICTFPLRAMGITPAFTCLFLLYTESSARC